MMNTKQIRMTFICDQNWDSMTPTANGRFCSVCDHEVFDFSLKSIEEIKATKSGQNKNICGRFNIIPDPNILAPLKTPRQLKWLTILSSLFVSLSLKTVSAQTTKKNQTEQTDLKSKVNTNSDTIYVDCDSSSHHVTDSFSLKDNHKPFLTTKRKEYYWTKKFPFIIKTYKPIKMPTLIMGRFL
jgi:hypothetical protein